jgi:hypothetical protein
MRHRRVAALLAACLVGLGSPKVVHAAAEKIDCGKLHFSFSPAATADWSECYRYREAEATGDDNVGDNSVLFEHMLVDQGGHIVRIVEGRTGSSAYFRKEPVRAIVKEFDELTNISDWADEGDYEGYELVRFRATLWHSSVDCVGFLSYEGQVIGRRGSSLNGAEGLRGGYDCWRDGAPDRAKIEATLAAIR